MTWFGQKKKARESTTESEETVGSTDSREESRKKKKKLKKRRTKKRGIDEDRGPYTELVVERGSLGPAVTSPKIAKVMGKFFGRPPPRRAGSSSFRSMRRNIRGD